MANPQLIPTPFANTGDKNTIPESIGEMSNSATWQAGFPPATMTPKAAGGLAPLGQDMNGVLFTLSSNLTFLQSGGVYQFDSSFATAIGGYPVGALVYNSDQSIMYQSLVAANNSALSVTTSWRVVWRSSIIIDIDGKLNSSSVSQNTGSSQSLVMSQNATTVAINAIKNTASLSANGWHKDTVTGLITQWGGTSGGFSGQSITFPIPFTSAFYSMTITDADGTVTCGYASPTRFGFSLRSTSTVNYRYIAIGR